MNTLTKKHWNSKGDKYSKTWDGASRVMLSNREMKLISSIYEKTPGKKILDMGIGTGRILNHYLATTNSNDIYGVDIAESMVDACRRKFSGNKRIRELRVCDIANEEVPYKFKFDFMSAIRVLKYNVNWDEIIVKSSQLLAEDGIFIFTMLNKNSVNRFWKYDITLHRTTIADLFQLCNTHNLEIVEIVSVSKLPDLVYGKSDNVIRNKSVMALEKSLEALMGKRLLGREYFVAVKRK